MEVKRETSWSWLRAGGRKVHHWLAPVLLLPSLVIFSTGILLQLRQDIEWIQPKTRQGSVPGLPAVSWEKALENAQKVPDAGISSWQDLSSIDIKPSKGVLSFRTKAGFEVQLDSSTGDVLWAAPRRTGFLIELHQGSYFHSGAMTWVFLPTGLGLLVLALTGTVLIRKRMFSRKAGV